MEFAKDFGFGSTSQGGPKYELLTIRLDFKPDELDWECADKISYAVDEQGNPLWLGADELAARTVRKSHLAFPMLDGHLRGEVTLDVLIDAQGKVECARTVDGNPIALSAAMEASRTWEFAPFIQNGRALPVLGHLTISYDSNR